MSLIKVTLEKQHSLFGLICRTLENLRKKGSEGVTKGAIQARLDQLKRYWEKFEINNDTLYGLDPTDKLKEDVYFRENVYYECEDKYIEARGELMDALCKLVQDTSSNVSEVSVGNVGNSAHKSLPKITLPRFSGKYQEWASFSDLFQSLVGSNNDITRVEKLHYLKSVLTDEAAKLVASIPITDDNFQRAWDKLKQRYANKRALVNAQLGQLFGLKQLQRKNAQELEYVAEILEALRALGSPVESWDHFLVYFICRRLDVDSHEAWEINLGSDTEPPTYSSLNTFLEGRVRALETVDARSSTSKQPTCATKISATSKTLTARVLTATSPSCVLCGAQHQLASCLQYREKTPEQRKEIIVEKRLCFNCLGSHRFKDCRVTKRCMVCKHMHHTTIHTSRPQPNSAGMTAVTGSATSRQGSPPSTSHSSPKRSPQSPSTSMGQSASVNHSLATSSGGFRPVLLATAQVSVTSPQGRRVKSRALIDHGSELSFVCESLVQLLQVPRRHAKHPLLDIGNENCGSTRGAVQLRIQHRDNSSSELWIEAHVLPKLTSRLPSQPVTQDWTHLKGLDLADPAFGVPGSIDLLLGANVCGQLLEEGVIKGGKEAPVAQKTTLGWVVMGPVSASGSSTNSPVHGFFVSPDNELNDLVRQFWDQESIPSPPVKRISEDDSRCEEHFRSTHSRQPDGRYVVRLPFKSQASDFGDSKVIAARLLGNMNRRFERNPQFYKLYVDFLGEYLSLGHMEPSALRSVNGGYFMLHHGVMRESSSTTKLRVVFNASEKTNAGFSLNDCLHSGPKIQLDLVDVLLRWRLPMYVFCADVEKMYRQVVVHRDDRKFQQILWTPSSTQPPTSYKLSTVTYGVTCAPFLAIRVLRQLADDEGVHYPLAADVIRNNIYVDDILAGENTLDMAREKVEQVDRLFRAGGFKLQRWASNKERTLDSIEGARRQNAPKTFEEGPILRALGLSWNHINDSFVIISQPETMETKIITKRTVLSVIARLYDPLGWLAPVLVSAKIFLQSLWKTPLNWDDPLPETLAQQWQSYAHDFQSFPPFTLRRWLGCGAESAIEIHGFSDASLDALSAVVYIRVVEGDFTARCSLVVAKTRVAPLKRTTIARLELSAAVLLTNLVARTQEALCFSHVPTYLWVDSSVALAWIKGHPSRWKDFVANRVAVIQETLPKGNWNYVAGAENPADAASRGLTPKQLIGYKAWWSGPEWLSYPSTSWPHSPPPPPRSGC